MGGCAAVRRRHTRGGGTKVPPASCESPPLPSGRAARARVSPALPLPPIFGDTVSKISATPRGGRTLRARIPVPGRSVAFTETTGEGLTSPAPPPPGSGAKLSRRDVIANKFFHRMWTNLFAVAGSCELPPAGVIDKRGSRPPLARSAAAQAANMQVSDMRMVNSRQRCHPSGAHCAPAETALRYILHRERKVLSKCPDLSWKAARSARFFPAA